MLAQQPLGGVLLLKLTQPLGFEDFHTAEYIITAVTRIVAHTVLVSYVGRGGSGPMFVEALTALSCEYGERFIWGSPRTILQCNFVASMAPITGRAASSVYLAAAPTARYASRTITENGAALEAAPFFSARFARSAAMLTPSYAQPTNEACEDPQIPTTHRAHRTVTNGTSATEGRRGYR